jgi:anti-anti-sigma factor
MEMLRTADATVIVLRGRFDTDAVAAEEPCWEQLPDRSEGDVCLDLSHVTFIDSAAIGTIAFLVKRLAVQGRELRLLGVGGQPRSLLELLRVDRAITMTPSQPAQLTARLESGVMDGEVV